MTKKHPSAPAHLKPTTRAWWASVVGEFELEDHHKKLLTLAAESWDMNTQAREALAEHGLTYTDRFSTPRARPEVGIERDSKITFMRALRELGLDVDAPGEAARPPTIHPSGGRKIAGER
ncbi:MAG: hypothetical protein K8S99_03545 [Planctomycetes bacterium]|nr:hypothetical protein [Planctomycetota bacterium]